MNVYNDISSGISHSEVHGIYIPLYALHLQMRYGYAPIKWLRLETGLGYLMTSAIQKMIADYSGNSGNKHITSNTCFIAGNITVPVYMSFTKILKKGNFICTIGPDFIFPIHTTSHQVNRFDNGQSLPNIHTHYRYGTSETKYISTMGLYFKLGYETHMVNIGPVVDFFDLVNFNNNNIYSGTKNYHPYQYYIGLDIAFNLRIITKGSRN